MDANILPFVYSKKEQVEPCVDLFEGANFRKDFGPFLAHCVYDIRVDWADGKIVEMGNYPHLDTETGRVAYFKITEDEERTS